MDLKSKDVIKPYAFDTSKCIHCGYCLEICPTYTLSRKESESPRGRLWLMRQVEQGRIDLCKELTRHIDTCLGCLACESVCPSSVPYRHILEAFREHQQKKGEKSGFVKRVLLFIISFVFYNPWVLYGVAFIGFICFRLMGLMDKALSKVPILSVDLKKISFLKKIPSYTSRPRRYFLTRNLTGQGITKKTSTHILLFQSCAIPAFFPQDQESLIGLLGLLDYQVWVARGEQCCGAIHAHNGLTKKASKLAKKNIRALSRGIFSSMPVVVMSSGCGNFLKGYPYLFKGDDRFSQKARDFSRRVKDFLEVLLESDKLTKLLTHRVGLKVVVDEPCHLRYGQGIYHELYDVLRMVPGLEILPFIDASNCCGAAGTYMLFEPKMSNEILSGKIKIIEGSGAEAVVTPNPGCQLQIQRGLNEAGLNIKVIHPIQILLSSATGKLI